MEKEKYREEFQKLKTSFSAIEKEYAKKFRTLTRDYLKSNHKHNIGDIIENGGGRIKIDAICYFANEFDFVHKIEECCKYSGFKLRKSDNKPFKNKERSFIYGGRDVKVIKKKE